MTRGPNRRASTGEKADRRLPGRFTKSEIGNVEDYAGRRGVSAPQLVRSVVEAAGLLEPVGSTVAPESSRKRWDLEPNQEEPQE